MNGAFVVDDDFLNLNDMQDVWVYKQITMLSPVSTTLWLGQRNVMNERKHAHSLTTADIREMERKACRDVLDVYNQTKSVTGTAGAIDYAKITGGRGAQYSDAGKNLPLLDFLIDVENTISETLTGEERALYLERLLDTERAVTTEDVQRVEERLGRQFKARYIHPVHLYFITVKKALPRDRV